MNVDITNVSLLQRIIRNAKEAVEKELGPIVSTDPNGGEKLNNFQYATYLELIRGVMANLPKTLNVGEEK